MIQVNSESNYYIVFAPDTCDGIFASFVVKFAYDNNLYNELWDRNVQCYLCDYSEKYDLKWFKDRIMEFHAEIKEKDPNASLTVMFLNYFIKSDNAGLKLFNICSGLGLKLIWICNDIDLIENYKHLNIPGAQVITDDSGAMQVWDYLKENDPEMSKMDMPEIIKLANAYGKGPIENAAYSWESQTMPFVCYLDSFTKSINDNNSDFVKFIANAMRSNDVLLKTVATIGKPIYAFMKNMLDENVEHSNLRQHFQKVQ